MAEAQPFLDDKKKVVTADSYIAATDRSAAEKGQGKLEAAFTKEIDDVKVTTPDNVEYVGLSKDELEQYAKDPFWRTLRIVLFILFWAAWIAMFAAAIVIVVVSPKCPEKVVPKWWQRKVSYQVWTPSLQDSNGDGIGDLNGVTRRVDNLRRIGVQSLRVHPLLAHGKDMQTAYDIVDYTSVHSEYGTIEDFDNLATETHDNGMYLIIDLPLTTMSVDAPWFSASKTKEDGFEDFFVWNDALKADTETGPAINAQKWQYDQHRESYYLKHKDNGYPVLNWASTSLRRQMQQVVKFWLDHGVDGFFFPDVDWMARTSDYDQPDWETIVPYLEDIRQWTNEQRVENLDNQSPVLLYTSVEHDVAFGERAKLVAANETSLNFVLNTDLIWDGKDTCWDQKEFCLYTKLQAAMDKHKEHQDTYPMWELGTPNMKRLTTRAQSIEVAELWNTMLLLLPGSISTYYGDEIGMVDNSDLPEPDAHRTPMQWKGDEPNGGFTEGKPYLPVNDDHKSVNFWNAYYEWGSQLKVFRHLAKLRQIDDVVMSGDFVLAEQSPNPTDSGIFMFSRIGKLADGTIQRVYVVILNWDNTSHPIHIDEQVLPASVDRSQGRVVTVTSNLHAEGNYWPRKEIDLTEDITLKAHQGIVVRFK